jgi:hypothetical protein
MLSALLSIEITMGMSNGPFSTTKYGRTDYSCMVGYFNYALYSNETA